MAMPVFAWWLPLGLIVLVAVRSAGSDGIAVTLAPLGGVIYEQEAVALRWTIANRMGDEARVLWRAAGPAAGELIASLSPIDAPAFTPANGLGSLIAVVPSGQTARNVILNRYLSLPGPGRFLVHWAEQVVILYPRTRQSEHLTACGALTLTIAPGRRPDAQSHVQGLFERCRSSASDEAQLALEELCYAQSPEAIPFLERVIADPALGDAEGPVRALDRMRTLPEVQEAIDGLLATGSPEAVSALLAIFAARQQWIEPGAAQRLAVSADRRLQAAVLAYYAALLRGMPRTAIAASAWRLPLVRITSLSRADDSQLAAASRDILDLLAGISPPASAAPATGAVPGSSPPFTEGRPDTAANSF